MVDLSKRTGRRRRDSFFERPIPHRSGLAAPVLAAIDAAGWLTPDGLAVIEIRAREEFHPPAGFIRLDERVYGAARLVFLRRA